MSTAPTAPTAPLHLRRGLLVAIEGPDRAGKTTVVSALRDRHGFVAVKRPDRTSPTGLVLAQFIRGELAFSGDARLNERAAQMVFACNNLEGRDFIVGTLKQGADVVMDRYVPSGVVYHSQATNGEDTRAFIHTLNEGMPRPDLVLVFEVAPEVAAARADFGGERNDTVDVQRAVGAGFRRFYGDDARVQFVDASRDPATVLADVVARVAALRAAAAAAETASESAWELELKYF